MRDKKICVIGLGYIGLPTSVMLANNKFSVNGVDISEDVVNSINSGKSHIVEPGLQEQLKSAVDSGSLIATSSPIVSDIYFICVPTPISFDSDKRPEPNIKYILKALDSIKDILKDGDMLILESTSPVGTTRLLANTLKENKLDISNISIAYCPERVLPGNIMHELVFNDRTIGGINDNSTKNVAEFYRSFIKGEVIETDSDLAELCKLSENSFRDVNIAFANELSMFCDKKGIDVYSLIDLANRHPRVNILDPGIGVGGHCIAVDPWFIVASDYKNSKIIRTAREINIFKTMFLANKIKKVISEYNDINTHVVFFGLSYKPNIDDLRESPAIDIVEEISKEHNSVSVVEPNIDSHPKYNLISIEDGIKNAQLIIFLVKHDEFKELSLESTMTNKTVIDFCGIFS